MPKPAADSTDPANPTPGPYCVVWLYQDTPDAFERAARYALQNAGYGPKVILVFTESGARLLQVDRMAQLFRVPKLSELVDQLEAKGVIIELDIGAARRAGIVETLGVAMPNLRIADERRVAELATGARISARY
jgi:predicted peroxiredoxin